MNVIFRLVGFLRIVIVGMILIVIIAPIMYLMIGSKRGGEIIRELWNDMAFGRES